MISAYYTGMTFLNAAVLIAVLGGMTRRESSEVRVYYAVFATVLLATFMIAARQSGLVFWLLSDPNGGQ